jgi:ADP-ribose pyrophosphatase YjhB (NUDIX family)
MIIGQSERARSLARLRNLRRTSDISPDLFVPTPKTPLSSPKLTREISAMAWIENSHGEVLLVRQTSGRQTWALPGGRVEANETVLAGLHREIAEETGLGIAAASQITLFDRPERQNLAFLYRVLPAPGDPSIPRPQEISAFRYTRTLPRNATPSLRHFWRLLRGK